jgi:hypothetical protein
MRSSLSFVFSALVSLALAPLAGCGGDEFSSDPGDSAAGTGGTAQGGAGSGQAGAGQSQGAGTTQGGSGGTAQGGAGTTQAGAGQGGTTQGGAAQGGAGQSQGGAGTSQGGAGPSQGGAGTSQGGAGTSQGGAGTSQGGAGTSQGGAGTSQGGAGTSQGGAGTSQGGAGTSQGGTTSQGGAGTSQGGTGGAPQCTTSSDCGSADNAIVTCTGGMCVQECLSGFVDIKGLCRDFGGAFLFDEDNVCLDKNPLTGDCSCPTPMISLSFADWPYDDGRFGKLTLCGPAAPVGQFGGAFVLQLGVSSGCSHQNHYENDCSCKSGADSQVFPITDANNAPPNEEFHVCINPTQSSVTPTIAQIIERYTDSKAVEPSGLNNCINPSEKKCACPDGTLPNLVHGARQGLKNLGFGTYQTDIVFCLNQ